VLRDPETYAGQRIELASADPTPAQMADAFTAALGRPVRHETYPPSAIGNDDMRAMWEFFNREGYQVDIPALHEAHPDIAWTPYAAWARSLVAG